MSGFLRRQLYLLDFTLSSLWRRKGKNLGLLLVYSLIVFLLASVMLFTHALRSEARLLLTEAPELLVQRLEAGRHALIPASHLTAIQDLRGVREARGRLWGYYYDPAVKANYSLMVSDRQDLEDKAIIIGPTIAQTRGLDIGDYLSLRSHKGETLSFRVQGLLPADSALISADLVLMTEQAFRATFGIPEGVFTDLALHVRNPRELYKIAEKISLALPDSRPILREEILRTYDNIFAWRQGIVFVLLAGAILAFVIFAWDKASGLSAEERREIGILKAVGWETGDVLRMKFWEGAVISLAAFLLGYLAAYMHVFFFSAGIFTPVLKGWAALYPDFQLSPRVDGLQLATLSFFTVFPYSLATMVPIWRTSITDPDAVMR